MAKHGGRRPGAGKKPGTKTKATLEKQAVAEAFNQRVMNKADALFNAQLTLAVGSMKVFRIDQEGEGKAKKKVHVHVTDADEIKALLDEHDGCAGVVDGVFYYFSDVLPDNRAIDSMLNRTLGKPTGHVKVETIDPKKVAAEAIRTILSETELTEDQARSIVATRFGINEADLISSEVM
jgi:hypothetical protein